MCVLTEVDLEKILSKQENRRDNNKLTIFPYDDDCLTPVGYDLRVGNLYASSLRKLPINLQKDEIINIHPRETVLIYTLEKIEMPMNGTLTGLISSKVTEVSKGLSHLSTTVDADYNGRLLIAVTNNSSKNVELIYEQKFCTIVFFKNESPSHKPSGKDPDRLKLFIEKFAEVEYKRKKERNILSLAPLAIILLAMAISILIACYDRTGRSTTTISSMINTAGVGIATIMMGRLIKDRSN